MEEQKTTYEENMAKINACMVANVHTEKSGGAKTEEDLPDEPTITPKIVPAEVAANHFMKESYLSGVAAA